MTRTALILAAHGSRHEPASNELVRGYAAAIASMNHFDEVVAAFHQGEPSFASALDQLNAEDVTVVPVMTSEGYYCDVHLPRELAKNSRMAKVRLRITPPVGTHPRMVELAANRARELAAIFHVTAGETALAIVGHGTKRHPRSRRATEALVEAVREKSEFSEVAGFFLDEEPGPERILTNLGAPVVLVIPFLISGGPHATQDIPRRLGVERREDRPLPWAACVGGRRIIIDRALGADPRVIEIIIALARDGTTDQSRDRKGAPRGAQYPAKGRLSTNSNASKTRTILRLGTRGSSLARWQAEHVAEKLRARGACVEIIELSTLGDRVLDKAIADLPGDAPFTTDIEDALRDGRIDLAVHSLKDLPLCPAAGLRLAALLRRGEAGEALVSFDDRRLEALPAGASVGTSSPRRAAQLLAVRPDLRPTVIRGPVDERVRQVRAGRFDAAILATAGLSRLGMMHVIAEELPIERFLPAPGQGALAVQIREADEEAAALCASLDDPATRHATAAELEFLRPFEHRCDVVAAAYAVYDGRITLHARLLRPDGSDVRDAMVLADNPMSAAAQAIKRLSPAGVEHAEVGA